MQRLRPVLPLRSKGWSLRLRFAAHGAPTEAKAGAFAYALPPMAPPRRQRLEPSLTLCRPWRLHGGKGWSTFAYALPPLAPRGGKGWSLRLRLFSVVDLAGFGNVQLNLRLEFPDPGKFLFGSKVIQKSDLNVLTINFLIEIEQMDLE